MSANASTKTIYTALAVNLTIAAGKAVVGALTGSAAMLAEALHSLADCSTEGFLLIGALHGRRWAKAPYFWALVAALVMFGAGGLWAIIDGLSALSATPGIGAWTAGVALAVLAGSAALECVSLRQALRTLAASRNGIGWVTHLRTATDVAARSVAAEDGLDIAGELAAGIGIGLHLLTGSMVWDGLASVLVGALLAVMAWELGRHNVKLLRTPVSADIDGLALAA